MNKYYLTLPCGFRGVQAQSSCLIALFIYGINLLVNIADDIALVTRRVKYWKSALLQFYHLKSNEFQFFF